MPFFTEVGLAIGFVLLRQMSSYGTRRINSDRYYNLYLNMLYIFSGILVKKVTLMTFQKTKVIRKNCVSNSGKRPMAGTISSDQSVLKVDDTLIAVNIL